jgi:hypothetical protein
VHPAGEGGGAAAVLLTLDDSSEQSMGGTVEEVVSEFLVNFVEMASPEMSCDLAALVKVSAGTARFRVRVGGTPGVVDGTELMGFSTNSAAFELGAAGASPIATPVGAQLVKIVAATELPDAVCHIRAKTIQFRGL